MVSDNNWQGLNDSYQHLTPENRVTAIQIEHLLNGISVEDAQFILRKISMSITSKAIIKST